MNIGGRWFKSATISPSGFDIARPGLGLMLGPFARVFQDERYLLVLEGETLDMAPVTGMTAPDRLRTAYGMFSYVSYDNQTREATLGTDRLGYSPLYYAKETSGLSFSTSLAYLKSQLDRRSPDYAAWEELYALGEVIGEKTTVREICRLNPGTIVRISRQGVVLQCFWKPEIPEVVDEKTYIRENNALLDEAICLTTAQTRSKVVLLSGGEDSRRIADSAVRNGLTIRFVTQESIYRGTTDRDTSIARELALLLHRPFEVVPMPSATQFFVDSISRDTLLGFESIVHEWLLPLVRRTSPASLVYDGIIGDVAINGHYFKEFPGSLTKFRDPRALALMICGSGRREWLHEIQRRAGVPLADRVQSLLQSYPESPHRLTFFFLLNHTRRKIAPVSQLFGLYGHWMCYPYSYYPLLFQSLSARSSLAAERFMQRECLAAISPRALVVPTTRGHVPSRYLRDVRSIFRDRQRYLYRNADVTAEAVDVFPSLRPHAKLLPLLRLPALGIALDRCGWFIEPLARYGNFLEWLRSDDAGYIQIRPMPRELVLAQNKTLSPEQQALKHS